MLLTRTLTFFILWGLASCLQYQANFNMMGITGWTLFNSSDQKATIYLTGTGNCRSFNISLTTFPVMYGHFASPCQKSVIGDTIFSFSVDQPQTSVNVSTLFNQHLSLDALSVQVDSCNGTRVCAGLTLESQVRTWRARFFNPVAGNIYIRQTMGEAGLRVLSDLRNVDPTRTFPNVSLFVPQTSPTSCASLLASLDLKSHILLGILNVGSPLSSVKSRLEIASLNSDVRFVVLSLTSSYVCAEIRIIAVKEVGAVFSMQGIKGYFTFLQRSPFDLTSITVNLTNLNRRVGPYHIHQFPLPQMRSPSYSSCSNNNVGGHWNPFGVNTLAPAYPPSRGSTHDRFEVGDLSARYGSLENMTSFQATFTDWNLPLFGSNSIVGRSVVIHTPNGTRFACAGIGYPGNVTVAKATFRGRVVGTVVFTQLTSDPYSDVSVFMDLSYGQLSAASTWNHSWHVHNYSISTETDDDIGSCLSTGGHWNPFEINTTASVYSVNCGPDSPFSCEVGDFSGKQRMLDLQSDMGSVATKSFFTDTTSWVPGMIGRSLVVHGANQTALRITCANLTLYRFPSAHLMPWLGPEIAEGQILFSQIFPQGPTILNINFSGLNSKAGGYHIHMLPIKGSQDPCSDSNIMGHFNPFSINASTPSTQGTGTVDQYEIGDISGKFGDLTGLNSFQNMFLDGNMPLSGPNSIIGRSLVIHYTNNSRMRCANIESGDTVDGNWVIAEAMFGNAVTGTVMMYQQSFPDGSFGDVMIKVDLKASNFTVASWYIAEEPMYQDGSCPDLDEMYNPFQANMSRCSQDSALSCMVGDLTGRHGPISLTNRQVFNDILLQLTGDFTIIHRALVLRLNNNISVCADFHPESPSSSQMFPSMTSFSSQRDVSEEMLNLVKTSEKMGAFRESKTCSPGEIDPMHREHWSDVGVRQNASCDPDGCCLSILSIEKLKEDVTSNGSAMSPKLTLELLRLLRQAMRSTTFLSEPVQAYIVPSGDAHQSEYIAPCDCRREFICGFNGSAGTAIVTEQHAALWTDGRYFLQASQQMDSNWTLMKMGLKETPSQEDWLISVLPENSRVGVDPWIIAADQWKTLSKALRSAGHSLVAVQQNLIDVVWQDRPARPCSKLTSLGLKYTGLTWQDKIQTLRGKMADRKISWFVVTALDEIAWLFNLRGSDIEYNPVFFAYALIGLSSIKLFMDNKRLVDPAIRDHLELNGPGKEEAGIQCFPYESVFTELEAVCAALKPKEKIWICDKASCALTQAIPKAHRSPIPYTPLCLAKAVKNPTEIEGMKMAHIKDAVALCELFAWLEKEIPKGTVTEISAADKAEELRSQQKDFVGLSFPTISSVGPNGAIIHYR
ncbi:hypothetical protein DNTS_022779 [Danionella cerebrum]|uniref:Peptidase M24 domain-containing protein n=1 Tax=Danionella cerebrum TaxID=2873325 RepID=A0A553QDG0_9TELE|nr:hypothetical protein DNTS_022779 [Danionella translucida]